MMLDIDDFKRVNDVCGHGEGDEVLQAIAEVLRETVRGSDVVCRVGGEEFAVILPSYGSDDALGLTARVRDSLARASTDAAGDITLSVGVAVGPEQAMNARELVACADDDREGAGQGSGGDLPGDGRGPPAGRGHRS
jgi:diguanylate cyclase (GGDEF)-like protein